MTTKIKEYRFVQGDEPGQLAHEVNNLMSKDNWQPQGGPVLHQGRLYQAMILIVKLYPANDIDA